MTLYADILMGTIFIIGSLLMGLMMMREGSTFGRRVFWSRRQFWLFMIVEATAIIATIVLHEILVTTGIVSEISFTFILVAALLVVLLVVAIRFLVEVGWRAIKHE